MKIPFIPVHVMRTKTKDDLIIDAVAEAVSIHRKRTNRHLSDLLYENRMLKRRCAGLGKHKPNMN